MANLSKIKVVSIAFLLLVVSYGGFGEEVAAVQGKMPIIDAAKKLFSLSSASDYPWISKVKALFKQGWPYGIGTPPNLDFRDEGGGAGEEGAAVKVKEAVVKSLDKSKATVEDSAKSAAEYAEDAVHKTVKQIKKTFSSEVGAAGEL